MTKKNKLRIMAAVSAALLLGGAYLLTRDDFRQKLKETEIKPYMPTPTVLAALDEASGPEITETTITTAFISGAAGPTTEAAASTASPELSSEIRQSLIDSAQSLNSAYPDAIGWLYISDTVISYPVMQSGDNDYYLSHAYDRSLLKAGSVFLDCRCENRFMNPVNILYGHSMKNGTMFAGVLNFADSSYFDSHRYGWLATSETVYRIDFFSCAKADSNDELYDGNTPITEWIPHILEKSAVQRDIEYSDNDRFISLSTCSYEYTNARTILTGKLVEIKED